MYQEHFNLRQAPFLLSPDLDIFYESSGHSKAYSYLQYGIGKQEGFIVITGEIGAGKTTLIEHLFANLDDEDLHTVRIVSSQFHSSDILTIVAHELGIGFQHHNNKAETTLLLNSFLGKCVIEEKRVLIVVDEAQNIPMDTLEELRMITNYHLKGISPVQIFLLGQPEFRHTINSQKMEQLRQRVVARYHLGALSKEETKEYINFRLDSVSETGSQAIFEEDTFDMIYETTGGIPRIINTLCDRAMIFSFLEEKNTVSLNDLNTVIQELKEERQHDETSQPIQEDKPASKYKPLVDDVDFLV